jgi:hypothetical protein
MTALILGGYGNFGKRIAELLARQDVALIIAGRDDTKAAELLRRLPAGSASAAIFDVKTDLARQLALLRPTVVVNTCGPFQNADYSVAETCIAAGTPYIDLADGRDFVNGIGRLDQAAKKQNLAVISGASTVPALSSAVLEHFLPRFAEIDSLTFGIAPGQKAERGLATTRGILSYVGKRLKPCAGYPTRYGWQDLYRQAYPEIGKRWMANCDIPDLDLLPMRYGVKKIHFSAGMESSIPHLGTWFLSWLVRLGLPVDLARAAPALLAASHWFDRAGSADGGMHMLLEGKDEGGRKIARQWFIVAQDGDGPYIPCAPAAILAKRIECGAPIPAGASACVGMITLKEYLNELRFLNIKTYEFADENS